MARALAMHALQFPSEERERVLAALRARRDAVKARDGNYWVFEDPVMPGFMYEFYEAASPDHVRAAASAGGLERELYPVLIEVEL